MRPIYQISIHHSSSSNDTVESMRAYHKSKGWLDIGYHWVILADGSVHPGRDEAMIPAAVQGHNTGMLAVCMVGNFNDHLPSDAQWKSMALLVATKAMKFGVNVANVKAHREFSGHESNDCCGLAIQPGSIRKVVAARMSVDTDTPSPWAVKDVQWAVDAGIITEKRPHDQVTREEMCAMLKRLYDKLNAANGNH